MILVARSEQQEPDAGGNFQAGSCGYFFPLWPGKPGLDWAGRVWIDWEGTTRMEVPGCTALVLYRCVSGGPSARLGPSSLYRRMRRAWQREPGVGHRFQVTATCAIHALGCKGCMDLTTSGNLPQATSASFRLDHPKTQPVICAPHPISPLDPDVVVGPVAHCCLAFTLSSFVIVS